MIFPNQVRGQVSAFFMFVLNLGGLSLGPFLPGFFNDHFYKNEMMIGHSVAITIVGASILQFILFRASYSHYRRDFERMHPSAAAH
jgi:sugar phosphate permease